MKWALATATRAMGGTEAFAEMSTKMLLEFPFA